MTLEFPPFPLSTISVYKVPWARIETSFNFEASSLNTSMKAFPIIFLFFSGEVTPFNKDKNSLDASL